MRVLKLDIDYKAPEDWRKLWITTRAAILKELGYKMLKYHEYGTSRGFHYYIHIEQDVCDQTANILQFLLGDDHTRVKINQWRIQRGIKRWNKLFSKVLWKKKAKVLTCSYCGNKIPVPDRWFKDEKR